MYKVSVHPLVVRLLDHFENKEFIYICLEKHQGVSLFDTVSKSGLLDESFLRDQMENVGSTI